MDSDFESPVAHGLNAALLARSKKAGMRWAVLTAYDYPGARLLEEAGVDWLLVGDSLGMVVLGYPDTTLVTLSDMEHHTKAVTRAVRRTPVVADLPYQSYTTPDQAVASARRLLNAGAHAVKLEGGREMTDQIRALTAESIPVMGHLGMLPQSIREEGAYRVKGKTEADKNRLLEDALALEAAGVFACVLELVHAEAAAQITQSVRFPTIGIGSGGVCDGQVLVTHDLVGAFPWFTPKFATPRAALGATIRDAARGFVNEVKRSV